jgi:hypothetical protein
METDYVVGNIRIRFASQARRRWFVALFYAALAVFDLAISHLIGKETTGALIIIGCGILFVGLLIIFTWIAGDMRTRGDEREMYRRDHAHYLAYYFVGYGLMGALFAGSFRAPNPITPLLPLALRAFLVQLPHVLLWATFFLYITLPQAILLWTEPDIEAEQQA